MCTWAGLGPAIRADRPASCCSTTFCEQWCECPWFSTRHFGWWEFVPSSDVHMFLKDWESDVDGIRIQQSICSSFFFCFAYCHRDTWYRIRSCSLLCAAVTWLAGDPITSSGGLGGDLPQLKVDASNTSPTSAPPFPRLPFNYVHPNSILFQTSIILWRFGIFPHYGPLEGYLQHQWRPDSSSSPCRTSSVYVAYPYAY